MNVPQLLAAGAGAAACTRNSANGNSHDDACRWPAYRRNARTTPGSGNSGNTAGRHAARRRATAAARSKDDRANPRSPSGRTAPDANGHCAARSGTAAGPARLLPLGALARCSARERDDGDDSRFAVVGRTAVSERDCTPAEPCCAFPAWRRPIWCAAGVSAAMGSAGGNSASAGSTARRGGSRCPRPSATGPAACGRSARLRSSRRAPLPKVKWHDKSDLSAVSQCRVIGFLEFPCRGCRVRQETELK
jgi:hypothetical protein